MRQWKRQRLELTRTSFDRLCRHMGSAYELWIDLTEIVKPAVGATLLGDSIDPRPPPTTCHFETSGCGAGTVFERTSSRFIWIQKMSPTG